MTIITAFRRLKQEDQEVEASLGYIARPCLKKKKSVFIELFYLFKVIILLEKVKTICKTKNKPVRERNNSKLNQESMCKEENFCSE
jgi:hypothetical protein